MRYISELEHKVQTLHTEATIFSAKLTLLQDLSPWFGLFADYFPGLCD
ncbi:hypothetical protein MtrunA17_Chr7g0223201 [Medicago truncatula]|uniref:Uncharacterized protein n=1 Tax=Medicago truncatula TaxID=3880 RepID=A0A396GUH3_MEDTR|nr:hypothetical protein MtrunA17_Chr7g0223201 [Medicago truncatula]